MHLLPDIGAGLAGMSLGAIAGVVVGRAIRSRAAWWFWVAGAAVLLVGIALASYADITGARAWWVASIGLIAGGLTGLKYGSARVGVHAAPATTSRRADPSRPPDDDPSADRPVTRH